MSSFPNSPRLVKGGIVMIDAGSARVQRVISLQYNPDSVKRTLQAQRIGEGAEHSEALRLTGPAVETFSVEAEIDAADQLEFPDQHQNVIEAGIAPQLAVLESLINPSAAAILANKSLAMAGTLEIAPMESALPLFVWGANRIVPVEVTEFTITEEAFDPSLNPIRATVSLGFRVLSIDDLGFDHKGGSLFMAYLQSREKLASKSETFGFDALGIGGIPS